MIHYQKLTKVFIFNFPLQAAICQLLFLPLAAEKDRVLQKEHLGFLLKYLLGQETTQHNVLAWCHTRFSCAGTTCGQLLHPRNESVKELRGTNAKQSSQGYAQPPKEPGWHVLALCSAFFLFCFVVWAVCSAGIPCGYLSLQVLEVIIWFMCIFVQCCCFRGAFSFPLLSCKFIWIRQLYKLLFWPEGERNLIGQSSTENQGLKVSSGIWRS